VEIKLKEYLEAKKHAWAASTMKTNSSVLYLLLPVLDGNPETLLENMKGKGLSPYTQKVNFQRVADFWDSFNSENPYSLFL
jgi:hypothetical protein